MDVAAASESNIYFGTSVENEKMLVVARTTLELQAVLAHGGTRDLARRLERLNRARRREARPDGMSVEGVLELIAKENMSVGEDVVSGKVLAGTFATPGMGAS